MSATLVKDTNFNMRMNKQKKRTALLSNRPCSNCLFTIKQWERSKMDKISKKVRFLIQNTKNITNSERKQQRDCSLMLSFWLLILLHFFLLIHILIFSSLQGKVSAKVDPLKILACRI